MSRIESIARRRGGRQARREKRAAPTPADEQAVRPGMTGGLYRPLRERDLERIHGAALDVLEQVGFSDPIPSCAELVTAAGGKLNDAGRLLFPRPAREWTRK